MKEKQVRGINILNPVDIDRDYYLNSIDYAIKNDYNHIQINGPIHNLKRSNLDGMMFYNKYSQFNDEKDAEYVEHCLKVVNEGLERSHKAGIKTYMWHHELEVPNNFRDAFPEIVNEYGDVEVSHPIIKDFLENKIRDFFAQYPLMDGFVLTYYETKIPLLRLKGQKMTVNEIMTYVTGILYHTCKSLGKEVIVRTNATTEKDYQILLEAYEKVSTDDLMIMEKWTQFDWSLSLPSNYFIRNIKKNPLLMETDLFGEYYGKGRLPLMLKEHIQEKVAYCEQYNSVGYCSRIDRGGYSSFGTVNEVNLHVMKAVLNGYDLEETLDKFFAETYGKAGPAVKAVMEKTEWIVRKMIFANEYYFSQLSWFPDINHSKNHFYFELMRENYKIASNEWFVPVGYERGPVENIFNDLNYSKTEAAKCMQEIEALKGQLSAEKYQQLFVDFKNLELASACWLEMANIFFNYVRYFDEKKPEYKAAMFKAMDDLTALDAKGKEILGKEFYCNFIDINAERRNGEKVLDFIASVKESFAYEETARAELESENLTDFVLCGSGCEGHEIQKEVNFSDTVMVNGEQVRITGNKRGMEWSTITAHGWFSYKLKLNPGKENVISVLAGSSSDTLKMKVTIGDQEYVVDQPNGGKNTLEFRYVAGAEEDCVRIRFDKISGHMPMMYHVKVR